MILLLDTEDGRKMNPRSEIVVLIRAVMWSILLVCRNTLSPIISPKKWHSSSPRVSNSWTRAFGRTCLCFCRSIVKYSSLGFRDRFGSFSWSKSSSRRSVLQLSRTASQRYRCDIQCRRGDSPGGRNIPLSNETRHDPWRPARLQGPAGHKACPKFCVANFLLDGQDVLDVFFPAFLELWSYCPFHSPDDQRNRDGHLFQKVARGLRKGNLHAGSKNGWELHHFFSVSDAKCLDYLLAFGLASKTVLFGVP